MAAAPTVKGEGGGGGGGGGGIWPQLIDHYKYNLSIYYIKRPGTEKGWHCWSFSLPIKRLSSKKYALRNTFTVKE